MTHYKNKSLHALSMALFVKPAFISVLSATFHVTTRTKGTDIMSSFSVTTMEEQRRENRDRLQSQKFVNSAFEYLLRQMFLLGFYWPFCYFQ